MSVSTDGGTIWFGANSSSTGNDNNTISFCDIGPAGSNLPGTAIYSSGTTSSSVLNNNNDTIKNCNIYDFFNASAHSAGIYFKAGTGDFVISNNKFYQTSARTQTSGIWHCPVWLDNGNNHLISGNTFGFSSGNGTGTYTFTGVSGSRFIPVFLAVGTTTATNVQGNIISDISISGTMSGTKLLVPFAGIFIYSGNVQIGNVTGNTIGSMSATGNISYTSSSSSQSNICGIVNRGTGSMTANNNSIGGITTSNSSTASSNIYGILSDSTGSFTCQNNHIGGAAGSINNTSTVNSTFIHGIANLQSAGTITGNTIRNMTASAGNGTGASGTVVGIMSSSPLNQFISQNNIYSLINTKVSGSLNVTGIYVSGGGTNLVERNFVHALSASSVSGQVSGIFNIGGNSTYQNNMISLGVDTSGNFITNDCPFFGYREGSSVTNNLYYNSIYIGGSTVALTTAVYSASSSSVRKFYNNILFNERSGYTILILDTTNLKCNHNVHYTASPTILASFNFDDYNTLAAWTAATHLDSQSFSSDPKFVSYTDVHIDTILFSAANNNGVPIAGITTDYDGNVRNVSTPDIGADEFNGLEGDITMNLLMFIEGFYDATSDTQVSDTVKGYLRSSASPYAKVDSSEAVASSSGSLSYLFPNAPVGNYYIVLNHRNCIETWSASAIYMDQENPTNYIFTTAASQAYGSNMKQIDTSPVRFGIYSGDENQDGTIDVGDLIDIYNDALAGQSGYVSTDINGDDFVDVSDLIITYNNSLNVVSVITP